MRIVHCCLSCFYIDGYAYQENMLVRKHVEMGHDVLVLASTETYGDAKTLTYVEPKAYIGSEGALVDRIPYCRFIPHILSKKLRVHPDIYKKLEAFKPDVIMFHGLCGWELLTVAKYVKKNSKSIFYADSHEDFYNSARSFLSRAFLYGLYYKPIIQFSKRYINKFLYITDETRLFCKSVYGLHDNQLEFFPLGGEVLDDARYYEKRNIKRKSLLIKDGDIVFFQSGKFDSKKKLIESLNAFSRVRSKSFKYVIAGSVDPTISYEFENCLKTDSRIVFLDWVDSDELLNLLCMADVYVQPGSQSATMQMSLAARCSVILDDVPSHRHIFCENGFLVKNQQDLVSSFAHIENSPSMLASMSENSFNFAKKYLDYDVLAKRLLK